MKIKSCEEVQLETVGMIGEIKEMFNSDKDEETLKILKRNIMRVLVMMSRDKAFIQLMKNIKSLEHFLFLLKSDLKLYEDKIKNNLEISNEINVIINLLPDFIKLVLTILKNYDLSQFDAPVNSVSPFMSDESKNIINLGSSVISTSKSDENIMVDIYFCLLKSLYLFNKNIDIVQDIFEFIASKEITKKYFLDYENILNLSECKFFQ